ncbi:MAG: hypothetical protein KIT44_05905 [Opitutaceae bacterium]|nr:hypothetical protein [Opitutaceae bacterium]
MRRIDSTRLGLFLLPFIIAITFAFATQHVWEDYYITWRSSKNLATGHGLVYHPGEKLHTFTSPLGVLLPAAASLLTFNTSDAAALWLFRIWSAAGLGAATLLLWQLARRLAYARLAAVLIIGWLALDSKIIDFSINGMETAFLLLFLAWTLLAHFNRTADAWKHLGLAWAGLMWTRPDSFIYIGLISAGLWLFNDVQRSGRDRGQLFRLFLRAGLLTTAAYLPWLIFAWGYYGTPVPHTITAKSGFGDPHTVAGLVEAVLRLPAAMWTGSGSIHATFLPAYYQFGGWPEALVACARAIAAMTALLWILPFLRMETRASSFAFFGGHVYLSHYPYFPFPWYLPVTTLLAVFSWGGLLAQLLSASAKWEQLYPGSHRHRQVLGTSLVFVLAVFAANAWLTWQSGRLFAAQQEIVEDGNRRKIGEWLRANSAPGDSVFMEPLGYIGYFSGLKTYDMPGLSSLEVVETRRRVGNGWEHVIAELKPRWLVLRPHEAEGLAKTRFDLLQTDYAFAREFSVADRLTGLTLCGLPYLQHDARFRVYERQPENAQTRLLQDESAFPISRMTLEGREVTFAHAPSALVRHLPRGATKLTVHFGFVPGAYTDPADHTDGAVFSVLLIDGDKSQELASRLLDPFARPDDRGLQQFTVALPARGEGARLLLRASPHKTISKDWTCWSEVEFE